MHRETPHSSSTARDLLRQARRRQRLSQSQLAQRAGVSQTVVGRYESGQQQPTVAALERLVLACGYRLELGIRHVDGSSADVDASVTPDTSVTSDASVTSMTEPPPRDLFPGPIGRRLTAQREEVLSELTSAGATDPRVYGDVADGTEGVATRLLIGVRAGPEVDVVSLMVASGRIGLLVAAEAQVLRHPDVAAYGFDDAGVPLTQQAAPPVPRSA